MALYVYPLTPVTVSAGDLATEATLANVLTAVESLNGKTTAVNTGAVVVSSSALPTGAATSAKQDSQITELQDIEADVEAVNAKLPAGLTVSATRLLVDPSGVTSPVSVASLPLPAGAATEATLAALAAKDFATQATLAALNAKVTAVDTGAVVVASSALPSGAATSAKQDTQITELQDIEADVEAVNAKLPAGLTVASTRLLVDGSGVTQPVSAASLPLPTGAATEATLSTIAAGVDKLNVVDQIDTTPLLDTSSTNIPASGSNPVTAVASLAANVKKIVSVEDIGEFIGVYTGVAASEVLLCVLPLGGGEIEVEVASGTRISLRNMKNAAISTGFIALNFLG